MKLQYEKPQVKDVLASEIESEAFDWGLNLGLLADIGIGIGIGAGCSAAGHPHVGVAGGAAYSYGCFVKSYCYSYCNCFSCVSW